MKEVILTSSVLILAVFLLRALFRTSISRRLQYVLWLVVAVRLVVPVSLPGLSFSVLSSTQTAQSALDNALTEREVYVLPVGQGNIADYPHAEGVLPGQVVPDASSFGYPVLGENGTTVTRYAEKVSLAQVLTWVWGGGMVLVGSCFLLTNLSFSRKLRKGKQLYSVDGCSLPVYLMDGLPSPCLFGLFSPAVYLTPSAVSSSETLRHVLTHEQSHYAQKDHLWAVLRCVCLTVYWFNPLVWAAALASKADCELACDERALAALGEGERLPYGKTLLSLIPVGGRPVSPLLSATTMTSGKRALTDRIRRIAENKRTVAAALIAVVALVVVICAVTFTGAKSGVTWTDAAGVAAGKPDLTISLKDLEPYTPTRQELGQIVSPDDIAETLDDMLYDRFHIFYYKGVDGYYYAACTLADTDEKTIFLLAKLPVGVAYKSLRLSPLPDPLLGRSCFCLQYSAGGTSTRDFFTFDESGYPTALVLDASVAMPRDLDGDGKSELVSYNEDYYGFYFEKKGQLYYADVNALLRQAFPEQNGIYKPYYENKEIGQLLLGNTNGQGHRVYRTVHFNGDELEVWLGDTRGTVDHAVNIRSTDTQTHGILDNDRILSAAKDVVRGMYEEARATSPQQAYDDWRIESLTLSNWGHELASFRVNYEFHTAALESVTLGTEGYVTEDDWVSPGKPNSLYLMFRRERTQSEIDRAENAPGSFSQAVLMEEMKTSKLTFLQSIISDQDYVDDEDYDRVLRQARMVETKNLEITVEGLTETVPATLYHGDGYSIYIPDEGWTLTQNETKTETVWTSTANPKAQLTISRYPGMTQEQAQDAFRKAHPEYYIMTAVTAAQIPPELEPLLEQMRNDPAWKNLIVHPFAVESGDSTYIGFSTYPAETEEGLGARLDVMRETFVLNT